ncbi:MAG TPA: hypothetical protein VLW26_00590 [Steroidobacteraceae bacterium]|nr:hypothetical protein [Steroidobacteraceae bacterium]
MTESSTAATKGVWDRLREHKVAQWTLAYAAAAYTLLHTVEMVSEAMEWPHLIARVLTLLLVLGIPVIVTLAWYHGARALRRVSGPELTIITILLVIAGSVLWLINRTSAERAASSATASAASSAAPTASRTAIAVMPFANLTGDPTKDYLGDGLAEEVINTLTKVPGLQVPARTSSFAYKGRNTDIRQIARDLSVGRVLEGSVRSAGDRIRVTAQLINAQSGLHLWSQTYDKKFTDLFQLQDELARAIVQELQVNLNGAPPSSATRAPPAQSVDAYNLYLQGFSAMLQGTEQSLHLAIDLYGQALALDPKFARALAARSRARLTFLVRGYPLANAREDAALDAQQALALDPTLGVAHQALANVSALRSDWLQAEASYRAAQAADPNNPDLHSGYAMVVLAATGRVRAAHAEGSAAYRLAPASPNHLTVMAGLDSDLGLDAQAIKYAELATALGIQPPSLHAIYLLAATRAGRYTEASQLANDTLSPAMRDAGGTEALRLVYSALADPSNKPAAVQALQGLVKKLGIGSIEPADRRDFMIDFAMLDAPGPAYEIATLYLDEFERSGAGGGAAWTFLWLPEMRSFRQDSRFQAFATRLNLIGYWMKYGRPDVCDLTDGTLKCH